MPQLTTFGKMPTSMPKGFFKAIHFPVLAMLDQKTSDRRMLLSEGAGTRDLPVSIKFASKTSAEGGHDGAEVSGALFEVTVDPESGKMSGSGFLLNDENGRRHARLVATGAMRGNSVDLNDVRARFVEDFETDDYWVEFYKFNLGATTGVSGPAFAEAHAVVEAMSDDELVASFGDDPMDPIVVKITDDFELTASIIGVVEQDELVASAATVVAFDAFYIPEADVPTKIVVDAQGRVFGHLGINGTCHDGYADQCMLIPRPTDGYASFNKSGPLTERGPVETGPIFALGGHRKAKSAPTIEQAYGGIENAWADVRVTEGRLGPWISGLVRPGVSDELLYAVRASRISGHWVNGKLKAIVSVNAEGYDVPGSGKFGNVDFSTGFSFATSDDGVVELVASFPACLDEPTPEPSNQLVLSFANSNDVATVAASLTSTLSGLNGWVLQPNSTTTELTITTPPQPAADAPDDEAWAQERLATLLADDADADDV